MKHVSAAGLLLLASALPGQAQTIDPTKFDRAGPDQLVFSTMDMDRTVDPRVDFHRYAAGGWLQRVERPARVASIGAFDFMIQRTKVQLADVFSKAAAGAAGAAQGSPTQQVGDLYRSFMDTARLNVLGARSLEPLLAEIDAIQGTAELARYLGRFPTLTGDVALMGIVPSVDQADNQRTRLYVVAGRLILAQGQIYDEPDASPRIQAYLAFVRDVLTLAGWEKARAEAFASTALLIERRLQQGRITPAEAIDPRKTYDLRPWADHQAAIPAVDFAAMIRAMGAEPADQLVLTEPRYLPTLATLLQERSLIEIRDYLKLKLIVRFLPFLGEAFDKPTAGLNAALLGVSVLPPREERAEGLMREYLGHPVSRLYVEASFSEETRAKAGDMVGRIRASFLARLQTRPWLTEPTRKAAIEKLERLSFKIGHPDRWIDHSGVEIRPDDLVGNVVRLSRFSAARDIAALGKPVVRDEFANARSTLPIIVNAAYDSLNNGFEVPAAFLQPPAYDPGRDAASNFCRFGAVIGHEMTHGFDSGGRLFDAKGNMRDWWTPADAAAFDREAAKLVSQASAFEILPGLKLRGAQEVRENMADVGGITFAYDALVSYLKEKPEEDTVVDGLTARQRCFVSWAQLWTAKATEESIRADVMNDGHPPSRYRAVAPLQHVEGFYEAFGIRAGDPMWLPPEKRVSAW